MSALTLVLVAALCSDGADKLCTYMDVTQRLQIQTDAECYEMAATGNLHNIQTGQAPRYDCVLPAQYLGLIGEKPTARPAQPRRTL